MTLYLSGKQGWVLLIQVMITGHTTTLNQWKTLFIVLTSNLYDFLCPHLISLEFSTIIEIAGMGRLNHEMTTSTFFFPHSKYSRNIAGIKHDNVFSFFPKFQKELLFCIWFSGRFQIYFSSGMSEFHQTTIPNQYCTSELRTRPSSSACQVSALRSS